MAIVSAKNTTFTFNGGGAVAQVESYGLPNPTRSEVEVVMISQDYKTFIAGVRESGQFTVNVHFDYADHSALITAYNAETVGAAVITFSSGHTLTGNAFVTGYTMGDASRDTNIKASFTFRYVGDIAWASGA